MLSLPTLCTTPFTLPSLRACIVAIGMGGLAAACSSAPFDLPRDVGNMAYPQPLPQGNLSTTATAGRLPRDTGNMAYPDPLPAGFVGRVVVTRQGFDTGNMAYPQPVAAGSGPATLVR